MNPVTRAGRAGLQRAGIELRVVLGDLNRAAIEFQLVNLFLFVALAVALDRGRPPAAGQPPLIGTVLVTFLVLGIAQLGLVSVAQTMIQARDDGSLLRLRLTPGGLIAYVVEKLAYVLATGAVSILALLTAGIALTEVALPDTAGRWLLLLWVALLGAATATAIGAILGAVLPDARESLAYAVLPAFGVIMLCGTVGEDELPPAAGTALGAVPFTWMVRGLRAALLPEAAGSFSTPVALAVLTAWLLAGMAVAVPLLRRMTLRSTGSELARRRRRQAQPR